MPGFAPALPQRPGQNAWFLLVAFFLIPAAGARAGNLGTLKAAAKSYVVAMESALVLSGGISGQESAFQRGKEEKRRR
jgi:hypothetical protein